MGRRRSEPLSESLSGKRGSEGHRFEGTQGRLGSVHQRAFMKPYIGYLIIGGLLATSFYGVLAVVYYRYQVNELNDQIIKNRNDYDVCIERVQQLTSHEREKK